MSRHRHAQRAMMLHDGTLHAGGCRRLHLARWPAGLQPRQGPRRCGAGVRLSIATGWHDNRVPQQALCRWRRTHPKVPCPLAAAA